VANVYSRNMVDAAGVLGSTRIEPPTGAVRWIIRDLDVYGANTGVSPIHLRLRNSAGGTLWLFQVDPDTSVSGQWRGRQVVDFGAPFDILTDDRFDITLAGYELSLP
jgi:hypothetical protein